MNFSRKFVWPFSTTITAAFSTFCDNSTCWFPPPRAVSLEYQKVIGFSLLGYTAGSTPAAHFYPVRNTTKTTRVCSHTLSRASRRMHASSPSLDWFTWMCMSFLIGQNAGLFWLWFNDAKLKKYSMYPGEIRALHLSWVQPPRLLKCVKVWLKHGNEAIMRYRHLT